jgi:hypothetical protein
VFTHTSSYKGPDVPGRLFKPKKEDITEEQWELLNKEIHNFFLLVSKMDDDMSETYSMDGSA